MLKKIILSTQCVEGTVMLSLVLDNQSYSLTFQYFNARPALFLDQLAVLNNQLGDCCFAFTDDSQGVLWHWQNGESLCLSVTCQGDIALHAAYAPGGYVKLSACREVSLLGDIVLKDLDITGEKITFSGGYLALSDYICFDQHVLQGSEQYVNARMC